jgi:YVTN family beta-propeller protein
MRSILAAALALAALAPSSRADHPAAFSRDGAELWVANTMAGSVSVIDPRTRTLVREISFGGMPFSLAITPDDRLVFVANTELGQVIVLDRATRAIVRRIAMRGGPIDLAITPNGRFVYVTRRFARSVSVIDVASLAIVANLGNDGGRFQNQPRGIAVSDDGDTDDLDEHVWVSEFTSSGSQIDLGLGGAFGGGPRYRLPRVTKIAVANHTVVQQVELAVDADPWYGGLPTNLRGVHLSPDQSEVWIVGEQANTNRGTRVGGPGGAAPHAEDDRVFLRSDFKFNGPGAMGAAPVNPVIRRVSTRTGQELLAQRVLLADERAGRTPVGSTRFATWTPDRRYVYLANAYSMDITVLDARTLAEVAVVDAAPHVNAVLFDSSGYAWAQSMDDLSFVVYDVRDPARPVRVDALQAVVTMPMEPHHMDGMRLFSTGRNERVLSDSRGLSGVPQMSCATCHPEGGSMGLAWDMTELGAGPRLTTSTIEWDQTGRFGWEAQRDEVQDFINGAARRESGAGLDVIGRTLPDRVNDPAFGVGPNAGLIHHLDMVADGMDMMFARTPPFLASRREEDRSLPTAAQRGYDVFVREGCATCHIPARGFTDSGLPDPLYDPQQPRHPGLNPDTVKHDVGTLGPLDASSNAARLRPGTSERVGFDTPHLRHLFERVAYLHDGRALSIDELVNTLGATPADVHAGAGYLGHVGHSRDASDLREFLLSIDNAPYTEARAEPSVRIGTTWTYRLVGQPGLIPLVFFAAGDGELRLENLGTLLLDPATLVWAFNGFARYRSLDFRGELSLPFPIPNDPRLIGVRAKFQSLLFQSTFNDPYGLSNSLWVAIR